jgi:oligopeptide transport system permease protein
MTDPRFASVPKEKLVFVQQDETIHDSSFQTKEVGYFGDAWSRFKKNKSSVVAAVIIVVLILFASLTPIFCTYSMSFTESYYTYALPKSELLSNIGLWDGSSTRTVNQQTYDYYCATGAVLKVKDSYERTENGRTNTYYEIKLDTYRAVGYVYLNLTPEEYQKAMDYQESTGLQLFYPMVDTTQVQVEANKTDANYWYEHNAKGVGQEPAFLFGTDALGHDILSRLASGARFSLLLSMVVSIINFAIGTIYGAVEGYYGGKLDLVMERIADVLYSVPYMVLFSLLQLRWGEQIGVVGALLLAFVLTGWIGVAGTVRTQFYRYKGQEYVLAARTLGATDFRIIFRHILPNALGTIVTSCVLMVPGVIFTESTLSYLGVLNLDSSTLTSVGTMLSNGQAALSTYPHAIFFPALFISLMMISFNLFGNGLRDALNPSLRGAEE